MSNYPSGTGTLRALRVSEAPRILSYTTVSAKSSGVILVQPPTNVYIRVVFLGGLQHPKRSDPFVLDERVFRNLDGTGHGVNKSVQA